MGDNIGQDEQNIPSELYNNEKTDALFIWNRHHIELPEAI